MPITTQSVNQMFNRDVFTNKGFYVGKVRDVEFDLSRFRVRAFVIEAARGTFLGKLIGGKKGVIIPYSMVQSVGDVVIVKHITPTEGESLETEKG